MVFRFFIFLFLSPISLFAQSQIDPLQIPPRKVDAETGSEFMKRMIPLSLEEREEEIYKALAEGNMPEFLKKPVQLKGTFQDSVGKSHEIIYEVMPDYLAIGSDEDYCRIPMNPHTAQRLANLFGASLITSKISDHIYENAEVKLDPFFYKPVERENESIAKFILHNEQIEKQKSKANERNGQLIAGIKKDVILSYHLADLPDRVVIYGWHKLDGNPIQPVYKGHVDWYVDYSHGIRLMNKEVILDSEVVSVSKILSDPILFKILSNEDKPMVQTEYLEKFQHQSIRHNLN
ncbi:hypothetical protein [Algoriphagus zhangzhouensis]|uniref:Uncharacterized protein n=1 Tax=Algoriphagus zhangzhouensis TaxID=1073327 RepID=A0A1M7ZHB3_9BACT|nr:hypothetical protein [Algoriphagus zhangzhouensis]TDY44127.1 hypothetical protein A8938_3337 [Algoriphagus zhangzhouensis]SHO64263.1 hypothetical protein SAMN04488108_3332 [Algoriphagus zhangzhouensis]